MIYHISSKNLLFVEPCLSSQHFIHKAKTKGYGTFVISRNDAYLTLPKKNFMSASGFFQIDTQNEEAVLNLVKQISEKFKIDGVIPGQECYGPLTAKVATYLEKPGLRPEIAFKIHRKDPLDDIIKEKIVSKNYIDGLEYFVEGLIENKNIYIFGFSESFSSLEPGELDLGYIFQPEIDPILLKNIEVYLQEIISSLEIDFGFFCARVKLSGKRLVLLGFNMNVVEYFMPNLIEHATGIDYYDSIFKLFSAQPLSFFRVKKLNAGIIFFYKNFIKENSFNCYLNALLQHSLVVEVKRYCKEDEHLHVVFQENKKIGHAILVHQDYTLLKRHIKEILKNAGFLL